MDAASTALAEKLLSSHNVSISKYGRGEMYVPPHLRVPEPQSEKHLPPHLRKPTKKATQNEIRVKQPKPVRTKFISNLDMAKAEENQVALYAEDSRLQEIKPSHGDISVNVESANTNPTHATPSAVNVIPPISSQLQPSERIAAEPTETFHSEMQHSNPSRRKQIIVKNKASAAQSAQKDGIIDSPSTRAPSVTNAVVPCQVSAVGEIQTELPSACVSPRDIAGFNAVTPHSDLAEHGEPCKVNFEGKIARELYEQDDQQVCQGGSADEAPLLQEMAAGEDKSENFILAPTRESPGNLSGDTGAKKNEPDTASIDTNAADVDGVMKIKPRETLEYETRLADWDGNWMPAPVEWDARPAFNYNGARHVRKMERWMDTMVQLALKEPINVSTKEPGYLNGERPATGLPSFGKAISSNEHDTLRSDDPFTNVPQHVEQTSFSRSKEFAKNFIAEKKARIADRKADREANRRQLEEIELNRPPNPHVPKANIYIRPAKAIDMGQVAGIYNYYIEKTLIACEKDVMNTRDWRIRLEDNEQEKHAFLVAVLKSSKAKQKFVRPRNRREAVSFEETIVGFAYAEDWNDQHHAYCNTAELQVYVHPQHYHMGIGKTLVDRMIGSLDSSYISRQGTDFLCGDTRCWYEFGGRRDTRKIIMNVPYHPKEANDFLWLKEWLSREWGFEEEGNLRGVGVKHRKK